MRNDFAAFILTHGRADNVVTYSTLRKAGYTGAIYLLVDDEDNQIQRYREIYGDSVIVFSKQQAMDLTDSGSNLGIKKSIVYARNINFEIARNLGINYFWQLDDDYQHFDFKFDNERNFIGRRKITKTLDSVVESCVSFLENSGARSVAFTQGGDFIGGGDSTAAKYEYKGQFFRKVMNTFLFSAHKPVTFYGAMNDDVNMYVINGMRGQLFITVPRLYVEQAETQSREGGLTDMYREFGTYTKSFHTIMYAPSCVRIDAIGTKHRRIHHRIKWKNAVPKIVSESLRKASA